jgi:hypothetical protein
MSYTVLKYGFTQRYKEYKENKATSVNPLSRSKLCNAV